MAASFAVVMQCDTGEDERLDEQKTEDGKQTWSAQGHDNNLQLKSSKSCRRSHDIAVCVDRGGPLGNPETALVLVVAHPSIIVQAVVIGIGDDLDGSHLVSQVGEGNYPEENHQTIESDDSPVVVCCRRRCACYNDIDRNDNGCDGLGRSVSTHRRSERSTYREHGQVNGIKGKIVDPIGSQAHDDNRNDQLGYSRDEDCLRDI